MNDIRLKKYNTSINCYSVEADPNSISSDLTFH